MKLLKISIQNFLSFRETQEIDLADLGLVAVTGLNGSGKSTISEAIMFCLYGDLIREDLKVDGIVNNKSKKDCVVTLSLEDDNGNMWEVTRTRAVNAKRSNDLFLTLNGVDAFQAGIKEDTQEYITTLIG